MVVLDRLVVRCAVLLVLVLLCLLMLALHLHLHLLMVLLELLRLESLKRKREEARELTPGGLRSGDRLSESNLLLELLQLLEFPLFVHLAQAQLLPPLDELLSDLLLLLRAQLHVPFAPLGLCRERCECGVRTPPPGGQERKRKRKRTKSDKRAKERTSCCCCRTRRGSNPRFWFSSSRQVGGVSGRCATVPEGAVEGKLGGRC